MWAVVNEPGGTAFGSRVPGLEIGGKTGTVQVVGREAVDRGPAPTASQLEDHAWFTGFAPVEDPQMVVVVFVENGGHGGVAAAPLARRSSRSTSRNAPPAQRTASRKSKRRGPAAAASRLPRPASASRPRRRPDDRPRPSGSAAARPDRPLAARSAPRRAGRPLRRLDDRSGTRFEGWPPGRRSGSLVGLGGDGRRDPVRLPHAAEVLLRHLLREPAAAGLPARSSASASPTSAPGSASETSSSSRRSSPRSRPRSSSPISSRTRTTRGCSRRRFVKLGAIVGVPFLLVFLQPDAGAGR